MHVAQGSFHECGCQGAIHYQDRDRDVFFFQISFHDLSQKNLLHPLQLSISKSGRNYCNRSGNGITHNLSWVFTTMKFLGLTSMSKSPSSVILLIVLRAWSHGHRQIASGLGEGHIPKDLISGPHQYVVKKAQGWLYVPE